MTFAKLFTWALILCLGTSVRSYGGTPRRVNSAQANQHKAHLVRALEGSIHRFQHQSLADVKTALVKQARLNTDQLIKAQPKSAKKLEANFTAFRKEINKLHSQDKLLAQLRLGRDALESSEDFVFFLSKSVYWNDSYSYIDSGFSAILLPFALVIDIGLLPVTVIASCLTDY